MYLLGPCTWQFNYRHMGTPAECQSQEARSQESLKGPIPEVRTRYGLRDFEFLVIIQHNSVNWCVWLVGQPPVTAALLRLTNNYMHHQYTPPIIISAPPIHTTNNYKHHQRCCFCLEQMTILQPCPMSM